MEFGGPSSKPNEPRMDNGCSGPTKDSADIDTGAGRLEEGHASHCDNCFNTRKCLRLKSNVSCPIVTCRFGCGHECHKCKLCEHEDELCPFVQVPCINESYGCPLLLQRRFRGKHLSTCPASVVVCSMEWNRWPLAPGKCQPFAFDPSHLDVAATLRDEKTVAEWKEKLPQSVRNSLRGYVTNKNPAMPLGVAGHRIPVSISQANNQTHDDLIDCQDSSTESDVDESSDSPWGVKKDPPGLQQSVCNKLNINKSLSSSSYNQQQSVSCQLCRLRVSSDSCITSNNNESDKNGNENRDQEERGDGDSLHACSSNVTVDTNSSSNTNGDTAEKVENTTSTGIEESSRNGVKAMNGGLNKSLNIVLDVITPCQIKPHSIYTFICAREFRRDEFPGHFSQIHSDIHTQLNGWLFTRCPNANSGCNFGVERMYPMDENYRIVFNHALDAFCFSQKLQEINNACENAPTLTSLPFELLVHLTKYLDSLSINNLSITCSLLRQVGECVLPERGIVVLQWEKNQGDQPGWKVVDKKWLFTTAFSPIRKWSFGDVARIANHLKVCAYYDKNIPAEPFCYYPFDPSKL